MEAFTEDIFSGTVILPPSLPEKAGQGRARRR